MLPCSGGGKMSRSYKKTPILQDGYGSICLKWYKRQANKKVRRTTVLSNGKSYRKAYETWNLRDYKFRYTFRKYLYVKNYTMEEYIEKYKEWRKYYYWK